MTVADVNGVKIAGLLFDAGTTNSPVLLRWVSGLVADHTATPARWRTCSFRIGGAGVGKGHPVAGRQQQLGDRRRHVAVAGRPWHRRSVGPQPGGQRDGGQRQNVTMYGCSSSTTQRSR